MIDRYTREPMASLWTMQTKFERWRLNRCCLMNC